MKYAFLGILLPVAALAQGLDGQIGIHDPSTVVVCNNRFYTYGTGGGSLVSDDGWTWRRGAALPRRGLAPDVIHIGDRYYVYVAANIGAQPKAAINMISSKTLDPESSDYKWEEGGVVASSDGVEDSNAIDPGSLSRPERRQAVAGLRVLLRLHPPGRARSQDRHAPRPEGRAPRSRDQLRSLRDDLSRRLVLPAGDARQLLSRRRFRLQHQGRPFEKVTGPFLDHAGLDMIRGGGTLLVGSGGRVIGPGHFGLLDLGDGVQRLSLHYEADLDRGGASVLDIRPLLWKDGWPVAGENLGPGTYAIESVRTGTALELTVEGMPVGGRRVRPGPPGPGGGGPPGPRWRSPGPGAGFFAGTGSPIPPQDVAQVSARWPAGNVDVRMANYLCQAQQKWAITAVPGAGGYPGSPYFKIAIAGTDRTLAASDGAELVVLPAFTGGPEQLWRIEQLQDGAWRIMPKSVPGSKVPLALSAVGASFATLAKFDPASDKQRWRMRTP
jgi:arabinan endo-1,5-alpha-L-arabinosidase